MFVFCVCMFMNSKCIKGEIMIFGDGFNSFIIVLLNRYFAGKAKFIYLEFKDVFLCDLIDGDECCLFMLYV